MRFYRSKKICKGVRVSVTNNGFRVALGPKGANVSFGKAGTYLNTSIAGTGLSQRTKLGSTSSPRKSTKVVQTSVRVHMDDDGKITYFDENDRQILDDATIRKIKRHPEYANMVAGFREEYKKDKATEMEEFNRNNDMLVNIVQYSLPVYTAEQFSKMIEELKVDEYKVAPFNKEKPSEIAIRDEVLALANAKYSGLSALFKKKEREDYISNEFDQRYQEAIDKWSKEKDIHEQNELRRKREYDDEQTVKLEESRKLLRRLQDGDENAIIETLESALNDMELPFNFDISYDIDRDNGIYYIDLELPELDELPDEKAIQMADGSLKMKKKNKTEIQEDYRKCVFGFAVFFAAQFFNVSPCFNIAVVSGSTQRRDSAGNLNNDYLYSIKFTREGLLGIDYYNVNSQDLCMKFENRCNPLKSGILKAIEPYDKI